jgi:hypothetical protein
MKALFAIFAATTSLTACNAQSLLKPVDDARAAVKQRLGDDYNITLEIVEQSGKPDAYVCGYTQPPRDPDAKVQKPLSDDRLFIYRDQKLTLADDVGKTALGDQVDKDCPGLMRVKTVEPRMVDLPATNMISMPK